MNRASKFTILKYNRVLLYNGEYREDFHGCFESAENVFMDVFIGDPTSGWRDLCIQKQLQ